MVNLFKKLNIKNFSLSEDLSLNILSFGLGFTLLWAGVGGFFHPENWIGFVPEWVTFFGVSRELFLHIHSGIDILLALGLILNIYRKWAGLLSAGLFMGIVVLYGIDDVTFRDIALVAVGVVIFARTNK